MSASSDDESKGNRAEVRRLMFEKSNALKKCKSKAEKQAVEMKYQNVCLKKAPTVEAAVELECPMLYARVAKEASLASKRRDKRAEQQMRREADIRKLVGDGSSEQAMQRTELDTIIGKLAEKGLTLEPIQPDGDCLFASVSFALQSVPCSNLRNRVAEFLLSHRSEFEAFVSDVCFEEYCNGIRTSQWGSDVELEALSRMLQRRISVVSANQDFDFGTTFEGPPIYITFHERQYTSPHYNATRIT